MTPMPPPINDAPASTAELPSPFPPLSIQLFGTFTVDCQDAPLPKLPTRKEQWLLALLIIHRNTALDRSYLAGVLWPEAAESVALHYLRRSLMHLRKALGAEAIRIQMPTTRTLRFDLSGAVCDLVTFDASLRAGKEADLQCAANLYRGPLLLGCTEDWVVEPREYRQQGVVVALEALATKAIERGDMASAIGHLQRGLDLEPLRESTLRNLMTALHTQGRGAAATDLYRVFRQRIRRDLGTEPDSATIRLSREIQAAGRKQATTAKPGERAAASSSPAGDARGNLPAPFSALIGRDTELAAVVEILEEARLVTITGPGGVGKTRLSLAVAEAVSADFTDGCYFVDLTALTVPALLPSALAATLGVREQSGRATTQVVEEFLRERHLLLVLDNCEHLLSACADLAQSLLRTCAHLHILATSRELLRAPAERIVSLPGLPPSDAIQLFERRAAEASFGFRVSATNEEAISQTCRLLDGMPLAIEMAAARSRGMSVAQIAARMDDAFRLLNRPDGNLDPRHQTLQATLDWSYDLLTEAERTLIARAAVFSGGWTLAAAEAVCADVVEGFLPHIESADVLDLLASLVDKSLVVFAEDGEGAGRYRLLETIRQYASGKLRAEGRERALRLSHGAYFSTLAETGRAELMGPNQPHWMTLLETENANVRASLAWCEAHTDSVEAVALGVRLTVASLRFWLLSNRITEARDWARRALEYSAGRLPEADARLRLGLLQGAGTLAFNQGDYREARGLYEEVLAVSESSDDHEGLATALGGLAAIAETESRFAEARERFERRLALRKQFGDPRGIADALNDVATIATRQGEFDYAATLLDEALTLKRTIGNALSIAISLHNRGLVAQYQTDYSLARALYEECLALKRPLGNARTVALTLANLGEVITVLGDLPLGKAMHEEELSLWRKDGNQPGIASALCELGKIAVTEGEYDTARTMLRESLAIYENGNDPRDLATIWDALVALTLADPSATSARVAQAARLCGASGALRAGVDGVLTPTTQEYYDRNIAALRETLGVASLEQTLSESAALSIEEANRLARL